MFSRCVTLLLLSVFPSRLIREYSEISLNAVTFYYFLWPICLDLICISSFSAYGLFLAHLSCMVIYAIYCNCVVNRKTNKFCKGGIFRWLIEAFCLRNCVALFVSNLQQTTNQRGEAFQKSKAKEN